MSEVITYTLQSGQILTMPLEATFGELLISGAFLGLLAVLVVDFVFELVYI